MPQLIPFYFANQVIYALVLFIALLHIFSKYILPIYIRKYNLRSFITNLKLKLYMYYIR